jgi:hypothetical protein
MSDEQEKYDNARARLEARLSRNRVTFTDISTPAAGVNLLSRTHGHPWNGEPGWVVENYKTDSHDDSLKAAQEMHRNGWLIWIVGNQGEPGFTVYREEQSS